MKLMACLPEVVGYNSAKNGVDRIASTNQSIWIGHKWAAPGEPSYGTPTWSVRMLSLQRQVCFSFRRPCGIIGASLLRHQSGLRPRAKGATRVLCAVADVADGKALSTRGEAPL